MAIGIIVLGATGMLGQALIREAARRQIPCLGISRHGVQGLRVDLTDGRALASALEHAAGRIVINAAALTDVDACERDPAQAQAINTHLPGELARQCERSGRKLVHVSTDHYFTDDIDRLHDEQHPVKLVNEYARSKFAGEVLAAQCPRSLVLRTNIVGLRGWAGRPTFVEWVLASLRGVSEFTAYDDVVASSIDVGQFAQALFDLLDRDASGLLNVAARDAQTKDRFIRGLARALRLDDRHCRTGHQANRPGTARANALGLDVRRAESLLQRRLPDGTAVLQALARTIQGAAHASP